MQDGGTEHGYCPVDDYFTRHHIPVVSLATMRLVIVLGWHEVMPRHGEFHESCKPRDTVQASPFVLRVANDAFPGKININVHPCVPRRTVSRDTFIVLELQIFSQHIYKVAVHIPLSLTISP